MSETTAETPAPALDMEARVAYLEAQNEGLKRSGLLGLLLVFVMGAVVVYQAWADLSGITTTGVVFQDSRQPRSALLTSATGHLALVPALPLGTLPQLQTYKDMDFQGLGIYDSQGRVRILLGVDGHDQPVVGVISENGQTSWSPLPKAAQGNSSPVPPPGLTPGSPSTPPAGVPGTPATP